MTRRNVLVAAIGSLWLLPIATSAEGQAISIPLSQVGNPGNAADTTVMVNDHTTGYGSVGYVYNIGTYDVTLNEYTAFLNAVGKTDQYGLYSTNMGTDNHVKGIQQSGTAGNYSYSVIGSGSTPVTFVTWLSAARFCNWLQNGQPATGVEGAGTTETGAYTLNGDTTSGLETRNAGATWWIPSEDEWYKAAYYDPTLNGGSGGYWSYPTRSNSTPGNVVGSGSNEANYFSSVYSVTQSSVENSTQEYLTAVGSFNNSASYYGTFDQGGDVYQWNDALIGQASRGVRGGQWANPASDLLSAERESRLATGKNNGVGFRVAGSSAISVAIPVISSTLSATGTGDYPFTYQITGSNSPTSFSASGLPPGVGCSFTGLISGTPTQTGTFPATIDAINFGGTGSATLSITIVPPPAPVITSTSSATGETTFSFSYQITGSNNPTSFSVTGLPPGVGYDSTTGLISGTPEATGTYPALISAINLGGSDTETLTITVSQAPPVITSPFSASGTNGQPFSYTIIASNDPTSLETGALPAGLGFDAPTGVISGVPTETGTYTTAISAVNAGGTDSEILTMIFQPPAPVIVNFPEVKGSYTGLGEVGGTDAALFNLTLTSRGGFTGMLTFPGAHHTLKGTFSSFGVYDGTSKAGTATVVTHLAIDATGAGAGVTGTITIATASGTTSYSVESGLVGTFTARTLPQEIGKYYTVVLPAGSGTGTGLPGASGYGSVKVSTSGRVRISGKLGDGTGFSTSAQLHADGKTWTLFELLYAGHSPGCIAGEMTFENALESDCDGMVDWMKPAQTTGAYYRGGFSGSVRLLAAKYAAPPLASGTAAISGTLTLGGGDLAPEAITDNLTISAKSNVLVSGSNMGDVSVTLTPSSGAFSGHFLYPVTNKKTAFGGFIYQKPAPPVGVGLFLGTNQAGTVEITQ